MNCRLLTASLLLISLFLTGCQECIDCKYQYEDPETQDSLTYNYDEFCGTSDEVDEFKARAKREAEEVDGELTCNTNNDWIW